MFSTCQTRKPSKNAIKRALEGPKAIGGTRPDRKNACFLRVKQEYHVKMQYSIGIICAGTCPAVKSRCFLAVLQHGFKAETYDFSCFAENHIKMQSGGPYSIGIICAGTCPDVKSRCFLAVLQKTT